MKVGIVTTPYGNNFGEVMQAYGLKTTVERLDSTYKPEVIDFTPESRDFRIKPGFEKYESLEKEKNNRFRLFREKYLGLNGKPVHSISEGDIKEYDIYMFGSDQIWNTAELSHPEFFGSFVPKGYKKISYAASIGAKVNTLKRDLFEKYIDTFDYISVREKQHVDFVSEFTKKKVRCVCDPTLLLQCYDYDELINRVSVTLPNRPYIFFYHPHAADGAMLSFVNKIARKFSMAVVYSFADIPPKMFPYESQSIRFLGPLEFLKYLRDSAMVVTRSYHATCFSILYHKPFYTFADRKTGYRVESLCDIVGASDHVVHNYFKLEEVDMNPDYSIINKKLLAFREQSIDFLTQALF